MKKHFITILSVFAVCFAAAAQVTLPDPGPSLDAWTFDTFDNNRQNEIFKQHDQELQAAMTDAATMRDYIESKRAAYTQKIIGPLPQRTPLQAKKTVTYKEDGYRIEGIIFQSIPGRYVTSMLFLPDGASKKHKVPAVLLACGHSQFGKGGYMQSGEVLAKNGIACLIVDPIGQGERHQFIDPSNNMLLSGSTTEHNFLCHSSMLTGRPLATRIFWDNSRAIDYLCSRPDIDSEKIGFAGNSGAGVQTMICTALDRRVKAAVVAHSSPYGWGNTGADGCGVMPFLEREGISFEDVCLMAAPTKWFFINGKKDFVEIDKTLYAISNVKKGYKALGLDNVNNYVHEGGHEFYRDADGQKPQEEMLKFFSREFLGKENTTWKYSESYLGNKFKGRNYPCTTSGEILTSIPDAKSVQQENIELFDSFAAQRKAFIEGDRQAVIEKVKELIGLQTPAGGISCEVTAETDYPGYHFKAFRLYRQGQVPIACALIVPEGCTNESNINICLNEEGKNALMRSSKQLEYFFQKKEVLLLADIRGFGETRPALFGQTLVSREMDLNGGGDVVKGWNRDMQTDLSGIWTGNTMIGQRVGDIQTLLDWCGTDSALKGRTITLTANGHAAVAALHAIVIDPRISKARIGEFNMRYRLYIADPMQRDMVQDCIPGVVQYYDLQDLINFAGNIKTYGM